MPFNSFDQKLLNQGWIKMLKKIKKKFLTRPYFLTTFVN